MNKKDYLIIVLKVIIYTCTLLLSVLGVAAITSCATERDTSIQGVTTIVTTDTTRINHSTIFKIK
nr:MAG TPA: hypothetical protein [Microviridae sp.]